MGSESSDWIVSYILSNYGLENEKVLWCGYWDEINRYWDWANSNIPYSIQYKTDKPEYSDICDSYIAYSKKILLLIVRYRNNEISDYECFRSIKNLEKRQYSGNTLTTTQ